MKVAAALGALTLIGLALVFTERSVSQELGAADTTVASFAEVDENGNVLRVIVADQQFINQAKVGDPRRWVRVKDSVGPGWKYHKASGTIDPPNGREKATVPSNRASTTQSSL